jgi:hypothetical protein
MHALPLLAVLVNPYLMLFRNAGPRAMPESRFGDEPNRKRVCTSLNAVRPNQRGRDDNVRSALTGL